MDYNPDIHTLALKQRFTELLYQYLKGYGHPNGSAECIGIPVSTINSEKHDKHLRSRYFVEAMTGTPYLPQDGRLIVSNISQFVIPSLILLQIKLVSHLPAVDNPIAQSSVSFPSRWLNPPSASNLVI